ncbi:DUF5681 domain-containing protein [Methylobacterium sp. E-005]|uniref:DUF5681 domain-containing protein n=1 Tax=Methylobacterium sp. E-005 TaxID=2836549 RepID=UPI001FBA71E8|nr:DUF5681 domain-containing protein [Methylobacterium sp. E-005]MCJ2087135.1 DUF5681 domain-containing protein [Methylobacterium sp. E-005]
MPGNGRPFEAGQSGNPAGRPKGSRNRTTQAVEAILEGEAETLTRKAVEMALDGDGPAMRLCLDRLCPPRKDRAITFDLPEIETTADLTRATRALLQGVADGEITPAEASEMSKLVTAHIEAVKIVDLAARVAALEETKQGLGARR